MSEQPLKVEKKFPDGKPDVCVMHLSGYLDSRSADAFEAALKEAIQSNPKVIILNGQNLSFISSAGIGVLLGAQAEIEKKGGKIVLAEIDGTEVFETFRAIGYLDMFEIYSAEKDAIDAQPVL